MFSLVFYYAFPSNLSISLFKNIANSIILQKGFQSFKTFLVRIRIEEVLQPSLFFEQYKYFIFSRWFLLIIITFILLYSTIIPITNSFFLYEVSKNNLFSNSKENFLNESKSVL